LRAEIIHRQRKSSPPERSCRRQFDSISGIIFGLAMVHFLIIRVDKTLEVEKFRRAPLAGGKKLIFQSGDLY